MERVFVKRDLARGHSVVSEKRVWLVRLPAGLPSKLRTACSGGGGGGSELRARSSQWEPVSPRPELERSITVTGALFLVPSPRPGVLRFGSRLGKRFRRGVSHRARCSVPSEAEIQAGPPPASVSGCVCVCEYVRRAPKPLWQHSKRLG